MGVAEARNLTNTLKSVCCANALSYAIFWGFHPRNSSLLTLQDAYYVPHLGLDFANMFPPFHLLGQGIVGEAAFSGKHLWMLSDSDEHDSDSQVRRQFSSGIKTLVVISVKPWGVVQFGSTQKILEQLDFLEQIQRLFGEREYLGMLDTSSSLDGENYDLTEIWDSFISPEESYDWNFNYVHAYSSASLDDSFSFISAEEGMTLSNGDSYCIGDQWTAFISSDKACDDLFLNSESSINNLIGRAPCFGTCSGEISCLVSLEQPMVTDMCSSDANTHASRELGLENPQDVNIIFSKRRDLLDNQISAQTAKPIDGLSQWFAPSLGDGIHGTVTESSEMDPATAGLVGGDVLCDIIVKGNSFGATANSNGQETAAIVHSSENSIGCDLSCDQDVERWGNIPEPAVTGTCGVSECVSGLNLKSIQKSLFSELGIEELLNGVENHYSLNTPNAEEQSLANKRQRTEYSPVNGDPTKPVSRENFVQPVPNLDNTNNLVDKKKRVPKSQVGLWIDDVHSINTGNAIPAQPQKPEEPTKANRKGTRPRPKDRQQIQDRIKELRGIIPHGGKCSIDSLLDRTIKYMIFLQCVTKYADKVRESNDPKVTSQLIQQAEVNGGGITWAFEVGDQTMVCPIIVEDMAPPGQMLIEMRCEEPGFFLEIADIIRGFGLNILKGNMENKRNKVRARFIAEAKRQVTRIDVFWYLAQLLHQKNTSASEMEHGKIIMDDMYRKIEMPHQISVTGTLIYVQYHFHI